MSAPPKGIIITSERPEATQAVGTAIQRCCMPGDLVAIQGELGAGKTQLVRGMAIGMGIGGNRVSSPTFTLLQEHEPEQPGRPVLVHIDAYRIGSEEDLASIGWQGFGEELREGAVVAIEWASLIRHALGGDYLWVDIAHQQGGRTISLSAYGAWRDRMQGVLTALDQAGLAGKGSP